MPSTAWAELDIRSMTGDEIDREYHDFIRGIVADALDESANCHLREEREERAAGDGTSWAMNLSAAQYGEHRAHGTYIKERVEASIWMTWPTLNNCVLMWSNHPREEVSLAPDDDPVEELARAAMMTDALDLRDAIWDRRISNTVAKAGS